jgi:penicillin-binding protein 1A
MGKRSAGRKGNGNAPARAASENAPPSQTRASHSTAASRKRSRRALGRPILSRLLYWTMVLGLWASMAAIGALVVAAATLPPVQSLAVPKRPPTVEILGTDGRSLASRGEMSGTDVPIRELPPYLPKAFIAIEDRRFYSHFGVDPVGLVRAAVANVLRRHVSQGGSTITQQLAKNLFLTQERTLWRKLQEVVLALWLEHKFSKSEILELYLNRVYFGSGAYGVEAAAQRYFGKSAR